MHYVVQIVNMLGGFMGDNYKKVLLTTMLYLERDSVSDDDIINHHLINLEARRDVLALLHESSVTPEPPSLEYQTVL